MRRTLLHIAFLFLTSTLNAQDLLIGGGGSTLPNTVSKIFPPAPEASALGKYVDIPVSLYIGTPQIGVPLYTVKEGPISLAISLSYQSGGFRTDEQASRAGLGWVLNAGGVITRTIRGYADEYGAGFLAWSKTNSAETFNTGTSQQIYDKWDLMARECGDVEPDEFFMNFDGYTGKFAFNWDGTISYSCPKKLKITPLGLSFSELKYFDGWEITTEDGMKYQFVDTEYTRVLNMEDFFSCTQRRRQVNSWFLSKITAPNGAFLKFTYTPYTLAYQLLSAETMKYRYGQNAGVREMAITHNYVEGRALSKITSSSGQVSIDFIAKNPRQDALAADDKYPANTSNYNSLDSIVVRDKLNNPVIKYGFAYDYSTGRLTLKSVTEIGSDGVTEKPPTKFEYNPGALPMDVVWYKKDHWGFLNNNPITSLLPSYYNNVYKIDGANRDPDEAMSKTAVLSKIIYPTGGSQLFEYEAHDYNTVAYVTQPRRETLETQGCSTCTVAIEKVITIGTLPENEAVHVVYEVSRANNPDNDLGVNAQKAPKVIIKNSAGVEVFKKSFDDSGNEPLNLLPGNYTLIAYAERIDNNGGSDHAYIDVYWTENTGNLVNLSKIAGGVRIRSITSRESPTDANAIVKRYEYKTIIEGALHSSGVILNEYNPADYTTITKVNEPDASTLLNPGYNPVDYLTRLSSNKFQLGTTQGSHIGYSEVTVYYGNDGEAGKSVSTFYTSNEYPDYSTTDFPYPPASSFDYYRGLAKEETQYKNQSGAFVAVSKTQYHYKFTDAQIPAYKVGIYVTGPDPFGAGYLDRYRSTRYTLNIGFSQVDTMRTDMIVNNNVYRDETFYNYDASLRFLARETKKVSAQKDLITEYYYPQDFVVKTTSINDLINRNMFPVLETISFEKGSDNIKRAIGGSVIEYSQQNGLPLPTTYYKMVAAKPIDNFIGTAARTQGGMDATVYKEVSRNISFDSFGNVLQVKPKEKENQVYLWGYNKLFPVARVENAKLSDVAYTDFEDDEPGGFVFTNTSANFSSDARTGKRSFKGPSVTRSISTGSFKVSFWAKSISPSSVSLNGVSQPVSTTWTYCEWDVVDPAAIILPMSNKAPNEGSITINTNGCVIDGVRLHPAGSLMETYTYEPLTGITSSCSVNNTITYYEYDALGRLSVVRDQDRNIVKNYQYVFGAR